MKVQKNEYILFLFVSLTIFNTPLFSVSVGTSVQAQQAALQPGDQKIVVAGYAFIDGANNLFLARYTSAGLLDTSFNSNGVVSTVIGSDCKTNTLIIDGSGKILVAGVSDKKFLIARYSSTGALDTTFGSPNGYVITEVGEYAHIKAIALDGSGNIIVTGSVVENGITKIILSRYSAAGVLDTSFATDGFSKITIGLHAQASALALQNDGKIVLTGFSTFNNSEHMFVARYNTNGSLDTTFNETGIMQTTIGLVSHAYAMGIQSDGKIIVVGDSNKNIVLTRYTSTGVLDTAFGTNGIVTVAVGEESSAYTIKLQADGKIVIAGQALVDAGSSKGEALLVARYTISGSLDITFGTNGISTFSIGSENHASGLIIQADTNIVAVGHADNDAALIRVNSSGALDASFGENGIVTDPGGSDSLGVTYLSDRKTSGMAGGTFTAGAWQTRDLNTIIGRQGNVSLSNNTITLKPGIYEIYIQAPGNAVDNHKTRLYNVTNAVTEKIGVNSKSSSSENTTTLSTLQHLLVVSKQSQYVVQHRCSTTRTDDGFGQAMGFSGVCEMYTHIKIVQIG